jgi:inorganic pyrophosphatase
MADNTIKVFIDIPAMSTVRYETEKATRHIFVDRFVKTSMYYHCNYGFIPQTLAGDNDELHVLVITPTPLRVGVYIYCRPIGVLNMIDEKGEDAKIIAVPSKEYAFINSIEDLEKTNPSFLKELRYFFEHYKDLDKGKWVQVKPGFQGPKDADALIESATLAYRKEQKDL